MQSFAHGLDQHSAILTFPNYIDGECWTLGEKKSFAEKDQKTGTSFVRQLPAIVIISLLMLSNEKFSKNRLFYPPVRPCEKHL